MHAHHQAEKTGGGKGRKRKGKDACRPAPGCLPRSAHPTHHHIRRKLGPVRRKQRIGPAAEKMLLGIREDAQWLTRMVENLLSITKLDGTNVRLFKTSTVLDEFLDTALIHFHKRYPCQEVSVDLPEEFISIQMDALLIEQVLINAVCHAKGMTMLSLKVFTIHGRVVFEIADDGCGIEKERLKHIFKGYYNTETLPSDCRRSNAGIGLCVCSAIIRAHGGTIEAENTKNGGAVFRFQLDTEEEIHEQQI